MLFSKLGRPGALLLALMPAFPLVTLLTPLIPPIVLLLLPPAPPPLLLLALFGFKFEIEFAFAAWPLGG